jgi:fatty acid desaturase
VFKQFLRDPNYLTKYHWIVSGLLFVVNIFLFARSSPDLSSLLLFLPVLWFGSLPDIRIVAAAYLYACAVTYLNPAFDVYSVLAILPALILIFPFTSLIHNPSHDSIRPRWLNRPVGELVGLIHMIGFPDWKIIHIFHHQYADDPQLDPHTPGDKTFRSFALGMRQQAISAFVLHYTRRFGAHEASISRLKWFGRASRVDMLMRISFWYLVLGPQLFTFFFLSGILGKMMHYAWLNFSTHRPTENGFKINNLNHNYAYKIINTISQNLYYHGNHHSKPSLANPKKMKQANPVEVSRSVA